MIDSTLPVKGVAVAKGRFAVDFDFNAGAFRGDVCWLESAVKGSSDMTFTTLFPR